MKRLLTFWSMTIWCLAHGLHAAPALALMDDAAHRELIQNKLKCLDRQLRADGFWPLPNVNMLDSAHVSKDISYYYGLDEWSFVWRDKLQSISFKYFPAFRTIKHLIIRPAASDNKAPYFDKPQEPFWKRQEAERKALPYAQVMGLESQGGYKPWAVSWREGDRDWKTKKYGNGYWEVLFRRHTKSGIPYNDDVVQVEIFEKAGPGIIVVDCYTWYDESREIKPIPEAEAEKAALAYARKFAPRMNLPPPEKTTPKKLGLSIVVPDTVKRRDLTEAERSDPKRLAGRPAYVFVYQISEARYYSVYIDAETGQRIGGSY